MRAHLAGLLLLALPTLALADRRSSLPTPPDGAVYIEWLHGLPQDLQLKINRFCSAHGLSYTAVCGGIGPLHIPQPPEWSPCEPELPGEMGLREYPPRRPGEPPRTRGEWRGDLTKDQNRYVDQKCRMARGRESDLCGPAIKPRCNTPLVVSFDDRPVKFQPNAHFSFAPGVPTATDWPTSATPWIALDLDGDGAIGSGAELFGSNTRLPTGAIADNGFTALAALDANHDGKIDRDDPGFAKLLLWSGRAGDALEPLSRSIVSISLASRADARCDARGNCEGLRASMTWRDAAGLHTGSVIDIYLPAR
jgi:hypothetical protein